MKLWIAVVLAGVALAQSPPYTTIADVLPPAVSGQAVQGSVTVSWRAFTYAGATVAQSPDGGFVYPLVNGVVNVALVPTDRAGAQPMAYKVVVTIGGSALTIYWQVPTLPSAQCPSVTTCSVSQVTVSLPPGPDVAINPAQISGVVNGDVLCGLGGVAAWCPVSSGGTWGSITGLLANQTDLQTALNGKQASLGFTPVPNTRLMNATAPLTGGGDLSANRTLAMAAATDSVPGYLTSADHANFNGKPSGSGIAGQGAFWSGSAALGSNQYLTATESGLFRNNLSPVLQGRVGEGVYWSDVPGLIRILDLDFTKASCNDDEVAIELIGPHDAQGHPDLATIQPNCDGSGWTMSGINLLGAVINRGQLGIPARNASLPTLPVIPTADGSPLACDLMLQSISGTGTVLATLIWTDTNGNAERGVTPTLSAGVGGQTSAHFYIWPQSSTAVSFSTTVAGTVSYDVAINCYR
jgi:hypothetical protein